MPVPPCTTPEFDGHGRSHTKALEINPRYADACVIECY